MPLNYNLDVIQGSTFNAQLFATNSDGTAVDLTGFSVRGKVKYNYGTGAALVDLGPTVNTTSTSSNGHTYTAASGVVDVKLTATETAALPITLAVYDIEMYNGDESEVRKLLDGTVKVYPEVTN
tara:strand:- start:99 stop:470 length:372 start_codon:yes stop_codon:yes gene_type:complete